VLYAKKKGVTQREVSGALKIKRAKYASYEEGRCEPALSQWPTILVVV
jgi:hypothetical protein